MVFLLLTMCRQMMISGHVLLTVCRQIVRPSLCKVKTLFSLWYGLYRHGLYNKYKIEMCAMLSGKFVALIIVCNFSKIVKDKGRNNSGIWNQNRFFFSFWHNAVCSKGSNSMLHRLLNDFHYSWYWLAMQ